jgi:hypothetical protein
MRVFAPQPTPPPPQAVNERVRTHLRARRRRQLLRHIVVTAFAIAIICTLILLNRDSQTVRGYRREAERVAAAFQSAFDRTGIPPQRFPETHEDRVLAAGAYQFNVLYTEQLRMYRPVYVCRLREPVRLLLRGDGYFVIFFDGRSFEPEWIPKGELAARTREPGPAGSRGA